MRQSARDVKGGEAALANDAADRKQAKRHGPIGAAEGAVGCLLSKPTFAVWRWLKTLRLRARSMQAVHAAHADPYLDATRVLLVDPAVVTLMAVFDEDVYAPAQGFGHVVDGDWDLATRVNTEQRYYRVVSEVITKGIRWRDTETGREARSVIAAGGTWMGIRDMEVLEERYRLHDELLRSMRSSGFYTQRELRKERPPSFKERLVDEILVGVGRDGRILLIDGRHRFAIASILGFGSVPVQVGVRHSEWMAFRRQLASYARTHGGAVPQPLLHPDLDNIPAAEPCRAIFTAVARQLTGNGGRALDIGSLWGYYAHRLEEAGHECVALEERAEHRQYLERLRVACNRRFRIVGDCPPRVPPSEGFVTALALERIDLADGRTRLESLRTLLRQTAVATLFVRPPAPPASGAAQARLRFDASWGESLATGAGFTDSELITEVRGIPILRLSR